MSEDNFVARSFEAYRRLIAAAPEKFKTESGFGGMLFFAGLLTERVRPFLVAANISGAASLVLADDAERGKAALRDGVVDFLVSSLDEGLRILKNDLRKKQAASVAVATSYASTVAEMLERGVQPDLVDCKVAEADRFVAHGAFVPAESSSLRPRSIIFVRGSAPQLARVDSFWRESFPDEDSAMDRWQRLNARYLGRLAAGARLYSSDPESAAERIAVLQGFIQAESVDVTVNVTIDGVD